jgi:hypothetical protein
MSQHLNIDNRIKAAQHLKGKDPKIYNKKGVKELRKDLGKDVAKVKQAIAKKMKVKGFSTKEKADAWLKKVNKR